jgi:L-alanine-DL-glutamate epimerase-like enolase superfamily enzyme
MAELRVRTLRLRLRSPLRAAWGELSEREVLHVRIDFGAGDFGDGEAAPLEGYDGVTLAAVRSALDAYGAVLARASPRSTHAELLAACAAERPLPHALAAVDLALWDRAGRRTGFPVAQLIAAGAARSVLVNATLRGADRASAAKAAAAAAAAGFRCVKLKVGIGDDAARVAAVRAAAGDAMAIRVDANGAWTTVEEALANLRALAPAGIELCEEPIHGVDAMRAVRAKSPVPLAMDETAAERGAPGAGAADAVCLKIGRCGGISGLLRDARAARAAGTKVYVASNFDGPLGIAAGVHAAAGLRASGPVAYCGLATLSAFEGLDGVLAPVEGEVDVPGGAGLVGGVGGLDELLAQ